MRANELLARWLLGLFTLALPALGSAGEHEYIGLEKCGTCHEKALYGNQVGAWSKDPHAEAYVSLASDKAKEYAKKKGIQGSPQQASECLECHVTAHGVAPALIKYDLEAKDGVQCESCHGAGADYRKREIMADEDKAKANGMIDPTEAVCTKCHNDRSPAWDPARFVVAGGKRVGFDYKQAVAKISHPIPPERKGKIIQLEDAEKAAKKKRVVR